MNGSRAKILRKQAALMTINKPFRRLHVVDLPPRERWVEVPDDGDTFLEKLRNKSLRLLGLPTPTKRVRQMVTPQIVSEQKGTTRWTYRRLKQMYYRLRRAA
jgi:hypothetical protein